MFVFNNRKSAHFNTTISGRKEMLRIHEAESAPTDNDRWGKSVENDTETQGDNVSKFLSALFRLDYHINLC